jgi:gamma-glutamylcyclotransferase (GGCT)/AIG2-like uncharacterized protein YtfP
MSDEDLFMQELMADPEYRAWCEQSDSQAQDAMDRMSDDDIKRLFGPIQTEELEYSVFVYGSLKRGFGNHDCLNGSEFLGSAVTEHDCYTMHSFGAFPAVSAADDNPSHFIAGELYLVSRSTLEVLDRLEGNGHFYTRRLVNVQTNNRQIVEAWMYLVPHSQNTMIDNQRMVVNRRVLTDEDANLQTWVQQ